jgi:ribosomal-protein-alanine N-acetyltransferase
MNERPANIETERLFLICLLAEEIEAIVAGDWERASQLTNVCFPPDDANRSIDWSWHLRALKSDCNQLGWRVRVVVERLSNTVIGSINLKGPPAEGDVEIGWGLNDHFRGKGYAIEASAAVLEWVVRQAGVTSISATVPDDNYPSQRVALRLGLTKTDETRRGLPLWRRSLR